MFFQLQLAGNPVLVVIVNKGIKLPSDCFQPPYIVGNLKEIMVVKARVQALVQFVVGYGVKHLRIDPTAVVAVDYLAHKPEIFLHPCGFLPHLFHEIKVQHIGAVQPDTVNIKFINPEPDHIKQIGPDRRIKKVETGKFKMSLPCIVSKWVPAWALPVEINPFIPVFVRGIPLFFLDILKCKKLPSRMVEYTVHHHADSAVMALFHKNLKGLIIPQPSVHQLVIPGVISVAGGFKERPYVYGVASKGADVQNPLQ